MFLGGGSAQAGSSFFRGELPQDEGRPRCLSTRDLLIVRIRAAGTGRGPQDRCHRASAISNAMPFEAMAMNVLCCVLLSYMLRDACQRMVRCMMYEPTRDEEREREGEGERGSDRRQVLGGEVAGRWPPRDDHQFP